MLTALIHVLLTDRRAFEAPQKFPVLKFGSPEEVVEEIELDENVFGREVRVDLLHQTVVWQVSRFKALQLWLLLSHLWILVAIHRGPMLALPLTKAKAAVRSVAVVANPGRRRAAAVLE